MGVSELVVSVLYPARFLTRIVIVFRFCSDCDYLNRCRRWEQNKHNV
ncbi:hypothetical protein CP162_06420 [Corynebacterium pseudotuberculosis Cp162]|nr:hypothetical protein CP162_06420 [Corynebacterium pseudotuberculosis Cp162]